MTLNSQIAEACARAAGVIAERGWCQGSYEDHDGRVCLMGSVAKAVEAPFDRILHEPLGWEVDLALNAAINASSMMQWKTNEDWNDFAGRDAREVVDLLEGVAWQYQVKAEAEKEPVLA